MHHRRLSLASLTVAGLALSAAACSDPVSAPRELSRTGPSPIGPSFTVGPIQPVPAGSTIIPLASNSSVQYCGEADGVFNPTPATTFTGGCVPAFDLTASLAAYNPGWDTPFGGTSWIGSNAIANQYTVIPGSYHFRMTFTLPAGATHPLLNLSSLADNAAVVYLNGHLVGGNSPIQDCPGSGQCNWLLAYRATMFDNTASDFNTGSAGGTGQTDDSWKKEHGDDGDHGACKADDDKDHYSADPRRDDSDKSDKDHEDDDESNCAPSPSVATNTIDIFLIDTRIGQGPPGSPPPPAFNSHQCSDGPQPVGKNGVPTPQSFATGWNQTACLNPAGLDFTGTVSFTPGAPPHPVALFVIGDAEAHNIGSSVNFWGSQWWKNNKMSGVVSSGVASFKGYATMSDNACGGTWQSLPGNSSNPPDMIASDVAIIVTSQVIKSGSNISGDIKQIVMVHQDGGYGPNPGHAGNGRVTSIVCPVGSPTV